jgi:predicted nucleotide-binding protein
MKSEGNLFDELPQQWLEVLSCLFAHAESDPYVNLSAIATKKDMPEPLVTAAAQGLRERGLATVSSGVARITDIGKRKVERSMCHRANQIIWHGSLNLVVPKKIASQKVSEAATQGEAFANCTSWDDVDGQIAQCWEWVDDTQKLLSNLFIENWPSLGFDTVARYSLPGHGIQQGMKLKTLREAAAVSSAWLRELLTRRELAETPGRQDDDAPAPGSGSVFVVHGRDLEAKNQVVEVIKKLPLKPIVLQDLPNEGLKALFDKVMHFGLQANLAVVIMTPDDAGASHSDIAPCMSVQEIQKVLSARARQNVIFEMGLMVGLLRQRRVFLLVKGDRRELMKDFSDFEGILLIMMDDQGEWKRTLARDILGVKSSGEAP